MKEAASPIPVICLAETSVGAFRIFNPNDWGGATSPVIQSCATGLSALEYCADRIAVLCLTAENMCRNHFANIRQQWENSAWDLRRTVVYGQVPDVHVFIQAFFAGLKSLLDLSAQLLSTEGIVGVALDGFHRKGDIYGGLVLNALDRNAKAGKKTVASAIRGLIVKHKALWIDEAVRSRDQLLHPVRGAQQLMFQIELEQRGGSLLYRGALPPHVGKSTIDHYAATQLQNFQEFAATLLQKLREAS